MTKINTIGIIGSGKMGSDICNYLQDYNYKLFLICENKEEQEKQQKIFKRRLNRQFKNGLIDQNTFEKKLKNCIITDKIEQLSTCNLIIEAISENHSTKFELMQRINKILDDKCIISSNSSSINPSRLIPDKRRESNTIGLHFFYPVKMKNIVEFIYTDRTSDDVIESIDTFLKKIKKFYIKLDEKNSFILNRVFLEFQAIAFHIINEYNINYFQLDNLVREKLFNMGVFDFFDSVGIDTMYKAIKNYIKNYENKTLFEPMVKDLKRLIDSNQLGKKTGAGFYNYKNNDLERKEEMAEFEINKEIIVKKLKLVFLNSVFKIIEDKICTENDINYAIKEYMQMDIGPVEIAMIDGPEKIHKNLMKFFEESNNEVFNPSILFLSL